MCVLYHSINLVSAPRGRRPAGAGRRRRRPAGPTGPGAAGLVGTRPSSAASVRSVHSSRSEPVTFCCGFPLGVRRSFACDAPRFRCSVAWATAPAVAPAASTGRWAACRTMSFMWTASVIFPLPRCHELGFSGWNHPKERCQALDASRTCCTTVTQRRS